MTNTKITDSVLAEIKALTPEVLVAHNIISPARKTGYVCPKCGNGNGKSGTGIEPENCLYHCFKCDWSGDNITLLAEHYRLDSRADFKEICQRACDEFGIYGGGTNKVISIDTKSTDKANKAAEIELIRKDISAAQINLQAFIEAQGGAYRGLTFDTLNDFHCGYLSKWIAPVTRLEYEGGNRKTLPTGTARFIVPAGEHYLAAMLKADRTQDNKKYWKMHAGTKSLFGVDNVNADTELLLIVEGEFDAMSLWQAGLKCVIATGGAAGRQWINELNSISFDVKPKCLILFDNDEAGKLNAAKLRAELTSQGYPTATAFLSASAEKVDANDLLIQSGEQVLKATVDSLIESVEYTTPAENSTAEKENPIDAEINALKASLADISKSQAEFDAECKANIEKLKDISTFDAETLFAQETIIAAACAKLFDRQAFSAFKASIQHYKKLNPDRGVSLPDFNAAVAEEVERIKSRAADLYSRRKHLETQIDNKTFTRDNDFLSKFTIPNGFRICDEGVYLCTDRGDIQIAYAPIVITDQYFDVETHIFKYSLSYKFGDKWQLLKPMEAVSIFDKSLLTRLSNYGLPIDSSTAHKLVEYFNAFRVKNDQNLSKKLLVKTGWQEISDKQVFIDPRRFSTSIAIEDTAFTKSLKSKGSLEKWKRAYLSVSPTAIDDESLLEAAKQFPSIKHDVDRLHLCTAIIKAVVGAACATPLLNILKERNFVLYIYGKTRGGKSTILNLAQSVIGDERLTRSFDTTMKALPATAAERNDYPLFVDEKQVAGKDLDFARTVYSLANGVGRARLNKDASTRDVLYWHSIIIANGEVPLLEDTATGGAYTRALQLKAPDVILSAEDCARIREIIKENYGLVFPLILDKINEIGFERLKEKYKAFVISAEQYLPDSLSEYCRYIAIISMGNYLLNLVLGRDEDTSRRDNELFIETISKLIPTKTDIDDTTREWEFLIGFIAANQKFFIPENPHFEDVQRVPQIYGKFTKDRVYVTAAALKEACSKGGFNYRKLVTDLTDAGYFIRPVNTENDRKARYTVKKRIGELTTWCFEIDREKLSSDED